MTSPFDDLFRVAASGSGVCVGDAAGCGGDVTGCAGLDGCGGGATGCVVVAVVCGCGDTVTGSTVACDAASSAINFAPHLRQKSASSIDCVPHLWQNIAFSSVCKGSLMPSVSHDCTQGYGVAQILVAVIVSLAATKVKRFSRCVVFRCCSSLENIPRKSSWLSL
jgi:hypothetical protein